MGCEFTIYGFVIRWLRVRVPWAAPLPGSGRHRASRWRPDFFLRSLHHSFSGGTDVDRVLSVASFEWNRPNPAIGWRPGSLIRVWAKTAVRRPWNWLVDLTGWRVRAAGSLPVPLALAHLGLHQDWDLVSVRRQCNAVEAVVAPGNAPLVGKLGPAFCWPLTWGSTSPSSVGRLRRDRTILTSGTAGC